MLRIKDSVNLKELEKFGFKKQNKLQDFPDYIDYGCDIYRLSDGDHDGKYGINIFVNDVIEHGEKEFTARVLYMMDDDTDWIESIAFIFRDELLDLANAGFLEKFDEVADENKGD